MNSRLPTDAVARARRLLSDGFVISAANVLVDDAKEAAREALEPPGGETFTVETRRDALAHALDLAIARLQQHQDVMRDAPADPADAALVDAPTLVPKKTRRRGRRGP